MCLDLEPADVFKLSHPKARKDHHCHACGGTIERGRVYTRLSWVFEGAAGTVKTCYVCDVFYDLLKELCGESQRSTDPSSLGESIDEHEDYWREEAAKDAGFTYGQWCDSPEMLGPGLRDIWKAMRP